MKDALNLIDAENRYYKTNCIYNKQYNKKEYYKFREQMSFSFILHP